MTVRVEPSVLGGTIYAPASKSSMQRACAAALAAGGTTLIKNPGRSNDDQAAIGVISALGAEIRQTPEGLEVTSSGVHASKDEVFCGESGLGIRMFTPLVAMNRGPININGEGSLKTRPMDFFDSILPQLGVTIHSNEGKLPLTVEGPLQPADIRIDGSLSSQFLTGLLLAYAASGANGVTISVDNLKSKPYVDLTLEVMKAFGMNVPENRNYEAFHFGQPKTAAAATRSYTVEGDWSGAAFLLVAGAIAGDIVVEGLDTFSTQADKAVLQALMQSGAGLSIEANQIAIRKMPLKAFHFDATDCPDLFPPLVALAACCSGTTVIEGVDRLAHKESNRGLTLQEEFGKMGVEITLQGNLMLIKGADQIKGAVLNSHHDHRIAMAGAVAALRADGPCTIGHASAINKSYPDFFDHIARLGAKVDISQ
ncbi:3-phosphoshikimate 1-carboxyvinyltransferase [Flavihumibacter petaseus]|uniref:3-phosphoshikimate 1-carboxyvinyltransferase n=1 Tax=Flavihumibacter petaseus NBRC 106054 TaxID=1220578 RepID=A0A0E9N0V0_9BACT|nr:3-phosphoshikimate 1-carboxyvinyltransferase [Flavihumibacter petaseus]GAO43276.1 3-phosphoshikimate 1-carboxyvinyltransferase [Flavihumibacter petaseus NBRC 106054]